MFEPVFFKINVWLCGLDDAFGLRLAGIALKDVHSAREELLKPLEKLHFNSHDSLELVLNIFLIVAWHRCARFRFWTIAVDKHIHELFLFGFSRIEFLLYCLGVNEISPLWERV